MLDLDVIYCIADDLTGALEAGAQFAGYGLDARVTSRLLPPNQATAAIVMDTESRHLSPSEAAARVKTAASSAGSPWLIYKKTDSTLRGNIGPELAALQAIFPDRRIVYVPAYPAMGRTVQRGELLVHGIAVHETDFARDPLNPIGESSIAAHLGGFSATILDGETDEDVSAAARTVLADPRQTIVAGPAAIAGALAAQISGQPRTMPAKSLAHCLIVNGSLHPLSSMQIERARQAGCFTGDWTLFEYGGPERHMDRARRIGYCVKEILTKEPFDAIIVIGGDTAYGIHQALGSEDFVSCGEVQPGLPLSRSNGLHWITKAGGFGQPDLFEQLKTNQ